MWPYTRTNNREFEWLEIATCPLCKVHFELTDKNRQYIKIETEDNQANKDITNE